MTSRATIRRTSPPGIAMVEILMVAFVALISTIGAIRGLAQSTLPQQADPSSAFRDGAADRQAWESWFADLTGDYRAGAGYWAAHRSDPKPATCYGAGAKNLGDWTAGCLAAQQRLAPVDVRRKTEPDYRLGWNSFSAPSSLPPPVSEPSKQPSGGAQSTYKLRPATIFITGNALLDLCNNDAAALFCLGYVAGVVDDMTMARGAEQTCLPADVTGSQLKDVVLNYIRSHPENRHYPAPLLVLSAFEDAFPSCQQAPHD
jgi:hypothetical protein